MYVWCISILSDPEVRWTVFETETLRCEVPVSSVTSVLCVHFMTLFSSIVNWENLHMKEIVNGWCLSNIAHEEARKLLTTWATITFLSMTCFMHMFVSWYRQIIPETRYGNVITHYMQVVKLWLQWKSTWQFTVLEHCVRARLYHSVTPQSVIERAIWRKRIKN